MSLRRAVWDLQELSEGKVPEFESVQQRLGPMCSACVSCSLTVSLEMQDITHSHIFKSDVFMFCIQEHIECTEAL